MTDFTTITAVQPANVRITQAPSSTIAKSWGVVNTLAMEYGNAREASTKAWKNYAEACEYYQARKLDRATLEAAYERANHMDEQASITWRALQSAKAAHLEALAEIECDCTPITTCAACQQHAAQTDISEIF